MKDILTLMKGVGAISNEIGILSHVMQMPKLHTDPKQINYGIWPANTLYLGDESFGGRSAGCADNWQHSILGTVGETVERYAPAFYDMNESQFCAYKDLSELAVHPSQFALFHEKQYAQKGFPLKKMTEDVKVSWFPTLDLTNGKKTWCPGQFIYLPFTKDENYITNNTSTGLAAHSDYYKAILTGLYESIERDSFVITWMQEMTKNKIIIDDDIKSFLAQKFPVSYEWHFFDITYDIDVPSVFGICFGEADYGKFVAVGSSTRQTIGEATQKVIQEIGQGVPYFRYLLGEKADWEPDDNFHKLRGFEDHSIFYLKRPDLWHVFDKWRDVQPTKKIDLYEPHKRSDVEELRHILSLLKEKGYNVLFKDLTTPDIRQVGFYSIKVLVPQLIQLAGLYSFYFLGGERLFEVPAKVGVKPKELHELNRYPHPFP